MARRRRADSGPCKIVGADLSFSSRRGKASRTPRPAPDHSLFLGQTRRFWQEHTSRDLEDEDAREIVSNVNGFFDLLVKWNRGTRPARERALPDKGTNTGPIDSESRPS